MEAYGLGQRLNIPTEEAAVILDAYFVAFPNVKDYMDRTVIEARERGYTETLFGRRRPIPELLELELPDPPGGRAPGDERRHPGPRRRHLQGGAGAPRRRRSVAGGYDSRLVLQVHDEVLVEVPDRRARRRRRRSSSTLMRDAAELDVPLEVNVSWGDTWAVGEGLTVRSATARPTEV